MIEENKSRTFGKVLYIEGKASTSYLNFKVMLVHILYLSVT
jgi:hypothetical protein